MKQNEHILFRTYVQSASSATRPVCEPHAIVARQAATPPFAVAPAQCWPFVQEALEAVPIHLGWVVGLWEFEAGGVTNIQGFRSHDDKYI